MKLALESFFQYSSSPIGLATGKQTGCEGRHSQRTATALGANNAKQSRPSWGLEVSPWGRPGKNNS